MGTLNYESPGGPTVLRGVNRQWQQLADSLGATFRPGSLAQMASPALIVPANAWTIIADTQRYLLRCRAVYVSNSRIHLRIDLHGVALSGWLGFLLRPVPWRHFIRVGDERFDRHAFLQSDQPENVRRLLGHPPLRDMLLRLRVGTLRVDPHPRIPSLSQVTYRLPMSFLAGDFDPDRVRGAIEVVRGTLAGLVTMGEASSQQTSVPEW